MYAMVERMNEQISDGNLAEVTGGNRHHGATMTAVLGRNGKQIGSRELDGITYWKCTHCGLPIYKDVFIYRCDACNDWWLSRAGYTWKGTEEELIAAAAMTL